MTDDIVTTLRRNQLYLPTSRINSFGMPQMGFELTSFNLIAADEIERLRSVVEAWKIYSARAERDIAQLREERDGARAEVSLMRPSVCLGAQSAQQYAESRGWKDLFRENTDDR